MAVAREVPCGHGFIDNLFVTAEGDIVLVETKLWRNSQMRREVVAQALDYIAALSHMKYEAFEAAIARSQQAPGQLYDLFKDRPDALEESEFTDAVAANLKRGRVVVLVVGDGIRSETEALSDLLQRHAGAHFTFALVEMATWKSPDGDILVVPNTLARTVMIERGIVRIEDGAVTVQPIPDAVQQEPQSISSASFMGALAQRNPSLPAAIQSFLSALEPLGVRPEFLASLNLKVDVPDWDKPLNFGYIEKSGSFWSKPAAWKLPDHIWRPYFEELARLVGGTVIDEPKTNNRYVAVNGRSPPRIEQLLPKHQTAWIAAIERVIRAVNAEAS